MTLDLIADKTELTELANKLFMYCDKAMGSTAERNIYFRYLV
jgi:hypothetical protein